MLPQAVARHLIRIGGMADHLNRTGTILIGAGDSDAIEFTISAESLRNMINLHEDVVRELIELNEPLAKIGKVTPHDWAKAEAEVGPEPAEDAAVEEAGDAEDDDAAA